MDNRDTRFPEQEAPLKNTDKAFVKVNKDGSPALSPVSDKKTKKETSNRDKEKKDR